MEMPPQKTHKFDGKMFFWNIGTTKQVATMGGVTDNLYMEAQNWGLGYNFLTYTGMFTTVISTGPHADRRRDHSLPHRDHRA